MARYFIYPDGRCAGECVVDNPVNPDGLDIITHDKVVGDPFDYVLANGYLVFSSARTQEQIIDGFKAAIQQALDFAAQANGYDDIVSACSYAGYENVFQAEAVSFGVWRAAVWQYGYAELAKVEAGERPVPTIEQILSELPARVMP